MPLGKGAQAWVPSRQGRFHLSREGDLRVRSLPQVIRHTYGRPPDESLSPPFPPPPFPVSRVPSRGLGSGLNESRKVLVLLFFGATRTITWHVDLDPNKQKKDFLAQKRSRRRREGQGDAGGVLRNVGSRTPLGSEVRPRTATSWWAGEVRAVVNGAAQSSRSSNRSDRLDDPDERLVWCGWSAGLAGVGVVSVGA